ncbi:MAG TPA: MMPL family transporter [Acidimicrobiia bacterium]|nr:MMPL family transporter [Acidimicrobiia bacterium]
MSPPLWCRTFVGFTWQLRLNPESIARASSRRPIVTLVWWLVLAALMAMLSFLLLGDALTQEFTFTNRPESVRAAEILEEQFDRGDQERLSVFYILYSEASIVDDPVFSERMRSLQQAIASLGDEVLAGPPVAYLDLAAVAPEQAAGLVSIDRHATLLPVDLSTTSEEVVVSLRETAAAATGDGFTVQVAGAPVLEADFTRLAEEDLRRGEGIGIAAALIVLVVVFAAVLAPLLPIVMGVMAIVVALGSVALVGQVADLNLFVTNMISMIGLAVGIDYSLFIVSRFREERDRGRDRLQAIGAAGATANRAVFFSGLTVVLALLGMFIVPSSLFRSLATGAIVVTLAAVAASMTLLPALLALIGDRIDWPRRKPRPLAGSGVFWPRVSRAVMAHPVVYLVGALAILGLLGSFYFQLQVGTAQNVSALPDDLPSKQAFETLERYFAGGVTDPARVVVTAGDADTLGELVAAVQTALASDGDFAPLTPVSFSPDGGTAEVLAYFLGDPAAESSFQAIRDLRAETVPRLLERHAGTEILVGGSSAFLTDFLDMIDRYEWLVVGFVLALSFLLLMVVFRSLVVPLKAILMNLVSVMAAYGAITLVFQKGIGIDFFNSVGFQFRQTESIESWIPLFLFSVLFGLSMDYHVFLLSRIRERYDQTGDNTGSVAYGLTTTARIITGAAMIMVAVFIGFSAGRLSQLQQMGFGLAVAVLVDATIIRTLIVPASMRLLGEANWYLPRWLEWLPRVRVEGGQDEPAVESQPV